MTAVVASAPGPIPLGSSVPALTAHAISVSLPTWEDNIGYEEGDKRVVDKMETGYPRFFVHRSIQKLAALCLAKFGRSDELCILLSSNKVALAGKDFLNSQTPPISSRIVEFVVCPSLASLPGATAQPTNDTPSSVAGPSAGVDCIELQILLFDKSNWGTAKAFWQHTGDGISSRMAERALAFLGETPAGSSPARPPSPPQGTDRTGLKASSFSRNRHYAKRTTSFPAAPSTPSTSASTSCNVTTVPASTASVPPTGSQISNVKNDERLATDENLTSELTTYLEERYGRNLPLFNAPLAKQALKRRIAGGLLPSDEDFGKVENVTRGAVNGGKSVTEDDVYLYPGGMSAIWHAHDIARKLRRSKGQKEGKSCCYGFPYTDTLKILSKWGDGSIFLGLGGSDDIPNLEALLEKQESEPNADEGKLLALFCEVPSNPLLRTPNMKRIRELADQYGFLVVIDETIGNFINVEVAPFGDIIVSSLTKIFSGDANVMGGSMILNPNGPMYSDLKAVLAEEYEDLYYPEDVVYMERNSRDYRNRIKKVNDNAYDLTDYLYSRSIEGAHTSTSANSPSPVIKRVYYPRWCTPTEYETIQRKPTWGKGGYGGLFSLTFTTLEASKAFYDTLGCCKGPSLGTSFTLASPYTILAHYLELDWAAEWGVEKGLVRISVGQEEREIIMGWFTAAVAAAEATQQQ